MKRASVLSILLFITLCLCASINNNIVNFYKSDYRFGAKNWMAEQQKNGIIYFANMNGLLSYDGAKWETNRFEGAGNNVHSLHIDKGGNIYIASQNQFGMYEATCNGLSEYKSLSDGVEGGINFREVWHICEWGEYIIFQASEYLFLYNGESVTTIKTPDYIKYSTVIDNTLYLVSLNGSVYTLMGSSFMPLNNTTELNGKVVCSILQLKNKTLLFITESNGAYIYEDGAMREADLPINQLLIKNKAFCAGIDDNILAVGTVQNGVIVYNIKSGDTNIINIESGLQNNTVLGLAFDYEHNLWLCLDRGISYLKIKSPFTAVFARNNPYGTGYCSLKYDDTVYLGTNQGLFKGTYNNGEITDIESVEGAEGQVYAIKRIDNHIFSCQHNGLFEIKGSKAIKIANIEGVWNIQRLKSNPNYLIAGHYNGFFLVKKVDKLWTYGGMVNGFEESCRLFEQDDMGNIWMSHGLKGVFKIRLSDDLYTVSSISFYDKSKGFATNLHTSVFNINGTIIFAAEDGIYTYNPDTDRMDENKRIESNLIGEGQYFYFNTDDTGRLWLLKGQSIFTALTDAAGEYKCIEKQSIIIPEDIIYEYFDLTCLDATHILVANEEGFTIVHLDMLGIDVNFETFVREITSLTSDSILARQYLKDQNECLIPQIDYSDNSIRITYGKVSFAASKNNQTLYSTRLDGYEKEWSQPSSATTREYTNLHEGKYTMQIKSNNSDNESGYTEFTFIVKPPFYRSIWAYLIYFILLLCLLFILYKYMQFKERKIEKQKDIEMLEQKKLHEKETEEQEKQIIALKNEQLESEIEYKSRELAGYTMNLVRKNEILIDVKEELEKIARSMESTEQGRVARVKLNSLIRTINENIEHDDDWKKFEENFDHVNQDFLKRLSEQFPSLTINDKKLCAYLKMNLVSKDIAPLLNISLRGVEIGRYRLRKKLNLSRDTNITEFLQNF